MSSLARVPTGSATLRKTSNEHGHPPKDNLFDSYGRRKGCCVISRHVRRRAASWLSRHSVVPSRSPCSPIMLDLGPVCLETSVQGVS